MTLKNLLNKINGSDKPYYTKGEIVNIIEKMIPKKESIVESNGVIVDLEKYEVSCNGQKKMLPRKVTEMTYMMVTNPGRVITRDEMLSEVWGDDVIVGGRTIDVHIRKIRKEIGSNLIKTIKGVGYQWG